MTSLRQTIILNGSNASMIFNSGNLGITSTKGSTGVYVLTYNLLGFITSNISPCILVSPQGTIGIVANITTSSNSGCTIQTFASNSLAPADCAFLNINIVLN